MTRFMGLDLGEKTLGIAVSDPLGITARGLETFRFPPDDYKKAAAHVAGLCASQDISAIVLGLPRHMNGDIGKRGKISQDFQKLLEKTTGLPVYLSDERLTTVIADKTLLQADVSRKKRRQVVDKMAAVLILQGYLDQLKGASSWTRQPSL